MIGKFICLVAFCYLLFNFVCGVSLRQMVNNYSLYCLDFYDVLCYIAILQVYRKGLKGFNNQLLYLNRYI